MAEQVLYTQTDEAPALATYSFLPMVRKFTHSAGVHVKSKDISLAARILAVFPDYLKEDQRVNNTLFELGEIAKTAEANIIKLPNISASIPQLLAAIKELQNKGYAIPDYPEKAVTEAEKEIQKRYNTVKGSAVNPVLREGNSDRRAPQAVKEFARRNPHRMGAWSKDSKSHVATMDANDFAANEKSVFVDGAQDVKIVLETANGKQTTLKEKVSLLQSEVIDGTFMSKKALIDFLKKEKAAAKAEGVLFSLHMKATMMKVSDPIIFGHAIKVFFADVFAKHAEALNKVGVNVNDGLGSLLNQIQNLEESKRLAIEQDIEACFEQGPDMAMVDSDKGISNLHVPSDVIIDASMPAMIRNSGQMWDKEGKTQDTKAIIPDSSYADLYQETISFCKENGAFDPTTMGTVPNVGLMAQKAEEYGSHDKTFEIQEAGTVKVVSESGETLMEHEVEAGDIWRMCQTKDEPIKNWVGLAVSRAKATGWPAVFWLDENRAHDAQLIQKVEAYLKDFDTSNLTIKIMSTKDACRYTLERVKQGENTISVTGNVLRDYLTDLFPILELGTSAKMLSIVPLMQGGGLFETGAGGSAPKHVQQLVQENHLRWDSLGEFLALAVSLEHLAEKTNNPKAKVLSNCLSLATEDYLLNGKSPSRKAGELDNRGSHFYLSMYWAKRLSDQSEDTDLQAKFSNLYQELSKNETQIVTELNQVQGQAVDLGGYYFPDDDKVSEIMRPSKTLNQIIENFS